MKYLALHVDTTGLNYDGDITEGHDIVAICLMVCDEQFNILSSITLYNSSIDDARLKFSEKYHGITRGVLDEVGLEEEQFVEQITLYIFENFISDYEEEGDYTKYPPIRCLGHNIGTFTIPFLQALLEKYDMPMKISVNSIDTHSLLVATIGNGTLTNAIDIFGDDPDEDIEYSSVHYKCKLFVNIFKQVKKLWTKKVLNG